MFIRGVKCVWCVWQDVNIINYTSNMCSKDRVLAACRNSLLSRGIVGLQSAPCLRTLLSALPTLVADQWRHERPAVTSGDRLTYSDHLKCLVSLVLTLRLDTVLCYKQAPPNSLEAQALGRRSICKSNLTTNFYYCVKSLTVFMTICLILRDRIFTSIRCYVFQIVV